VYKFLLLPYFPRILALLPRIWAVRSSPTHHVYAPPLRAVACGACDYCTGFHDALWRLVIDLPTPGRRSHCSPQLVLCFLAAGNETRRRMTRRR